MTCEASFPLGVRVTDVAVGALEPSVVTELRSVLAEHGVAVLPGQAIGNEEFLAFLRSFGDPVFTTGETPVDGWPDLNVISNVGRTTPPKSTFHVDTTYVANPPAYTALRAVDVPRRGGRTLFSNQYRAYETLPADVRRAAASMTVTHTVTGLPGIEGSAQHPLVHEHPVSGRTSLYLSALSRNPSASELAAGVALFASPPNGETGNGCAWGADASAPEPSSHGGQGHECFELCPICRTADLLRC